MTETTESEARRLRAAIMVRLHNLWYWRTKWAVSYLSKQLQRDPGFRESWHANIVMTIYDTKGGCDCAPNMNRAWHIDSCMSQRKISAIHSNYISDRLMKHLFNA